MRTVERDIHTDYVAASPFGTKHTENHQVALNWAHITVTTDATVGNRTLKFSLIRNSDGVVMYDVAAGVNQGASLTRHYNFVKGAVRETSFSGGNEILLPLPDLVFGAGYSLVVNDVNGVSAGDTYALAYQGDR